MENVENLEIPKMLTLKEAAQLTGMSYDGMRKLCLRREIVHIKVGSKYFVNASKLAEYLNAGTNG